MEIKISLRSNIVTILCLLRINDFNDFKIRYDKTMKYVLISLPLRKIAVEVLIQFCMNYRDTY